MSKAKMILSGVALFALIGGALAFKASRESNQFFSSTTTRVNGVVLTYCTVPFQTTYTTNPADAVGPAVNITSFHTVPTTIPCPGVLLFPAD